MLCGLESWRVAGRGTAVPCVEPGPLQQQKREAIPRSSPPIRPGVTYSESDMFDTKLSTCAGAPHEGHQAVFQPGAVGCRHGSTLLLEAEGLFLVL